MHNDSVHDARKECLALLDLIYESVTVLTFSLTCPSSFPGLIAPCSWALCIMRRRLFDNTLIEGPLPASWSEMESMEEL